MLLAYLMFIVPGTRQGFIGRTSELSSVSTLQRFFVARVTVMHGHWRMMAKVYGMRLVTQLPPLDTDLAMSLALAYPGDFETRSSLRGAPYSKLSNMGPTNVTARVDLATGSVCHGFPSFLTSPIVRCWSTSISKGDDPRDPATPELI